MIAHQLFVFSLLQGRLRQTRTALGLGDIAGATSRTYTTRLRLPKTTTLFDSWGRCRRGPRRVRHWRRRCLPLPHPCAASSCAGVARHHRGASCSLRIHIHTTVIRISIDGANHCALHCSTLDTRSRKFVLTSTMLRVRACIPDRSTTKLL